MTWTSSLRMSSRNGPKHSEWRKAFCALPAFRVGTAMAVLVLAWVCSLQAEPYNIAADAFVRLVDKPMSPQEADLTRLAAPAGDTVRLMPGNWVTIEWRQPREPRTVRLQFDGPAPAPGEITIAWWRRVWPDSGEGGWMKLDDPFNGIWNVARVASERGGNRLDFSFVPLDAVEAPGIIRTGFPYRQTYKLRISATRLVTLKRVAVFSDAIEQHARLRFEWGIRTCTPGKWAPAFEARNGRLLTTLASPTNVAWVELSYADATNRLSADRGRVIFRSGETRSFAVFVDDVLRAGGLLVRDIGVFVSDAHRGLTYASWRAAAGDAPAADGWGGGTVTERVASLPEQSLERLLEKMPAKAPPDCFLGVPDLRQEIALSPQGNIRLFADSLRSAGPDADRRPWKWDDLAFEFSDAEKPQFGSTDSRQVSRSLEEGWLPIVRHEWRRGDIAYVESALAAPLLADIAAMPVKTGAEPVALTARFEITNHANESRTAWLWMALNHERAGQLTVDNTLVLMQPSEGPQRPGLVPVRARFNLFQRGELDWVTLSGAGAPGQDPAAPRQAVRYRVDLGPHGSHAIELVVPYIELLSAEEVAALKGFSYTRAHESVAAFWRRRAAQGMTLEVPEAHLNELFKANLWHVLISTDLDPETALSEHGAATHGYKNFLNETAMVARSLEMRGEHAEAAKLLEPFLVSQGAKGLPGNFKSREGVFYAAYPREPDPYTAQGYNMHHGWGLWAVADHYFWTRDAAFLRRHAGPLAQGCDWIAREREATRVKGPDGARPVEFGLAPAGDLEDVDEFLYYYATDAYYYLGMKQAAAALTRIDHPRHREVTRETAAFLDDLRASVAESVATTPVVALRDGTYVPFVPPRAYALTHRQEGWIREGLYPALHLVTAGVYAADHPFADWMIQDLEDNIFMSAESGFGLKDPRAEFFDFGGLTCQPNLLDLSLLYLQLDRIPNFLRAFFNSAAASLYPDLECFAEWIPAFGQGGGPLYKTPDECKFIQWLRTMLIMEREQALYLCWGTPRVWLQNGKQIKIERAATYFGKLELEVRSAVAQNTISARVRLAPTEKPARIWLRLRHPEAKTIRSATVNRQPAPVDALRECVALPVGDTQWEVEARY